jgi:glyoxylase-like metal-dependent hydrolase (beta-lactamase superfamily II)
LYSMHASQIEVLSERCGLWRISDGKANSYALVEGGSALIIDPVLRWSPKALRAIGASQADAVLLTRPSKCRFKNCMESHGALHLSGAAATLLSEEFLLLRHSHSLRSPVSPFYDPPARRPQRLVFDLNESGNFVWRSLRFSFLSMPGHTEAAVAILLEFEGRLFCFCGDSVCEGGTFWEPHHLEWDHWTSVGARAALRGLDRLSNLPITDLLPAHGEPVRKIPRATIRKTRRNVAAWAEVKEQFVPGIQVDSWPGEPVGHDARRLLPRLYHLGASAYFLAVDSGSGLLIDAIPSQSETVRHVMRLSKVEHLAATATHYHSDHVDGLAHWRNSLGATIVLSRSVAAIVCHPDRWRHLPFLGEPLPEPPETIARLEKPLAIGGLDLTWHDLPGQTRYHNGISVRLDGVRVLFSGDNFFAPLRYNGTGGCCVANESTPEGYADSARKVMDLKPELVAAGHNSAFRYSPKYFQEVVKWAGKYRRALERLHHPADGSGYFATKAG